MENKAKVLLTGVTGFLGSHTAIQLLEKNYQVIGTLQNLKRVDSIRKVIAKHTSKMDGLTFAEANLTDEQVWEGLTKGVDFVQHIASPFPRELPKQEHELISPAKEGTLNILKAASANKVRRVVITSSLAAVAYGKEKNRRSDTFKELHWTNVENKQDTTPYFRSKTIAEKAAWDFMASYEGKMELVSVCPGTILGSVLEKDIGTSANIVIKLLDGSMPALPNIGFEIVDVRSVADLLIRAMEMPEAANERFIATSEYLSFKDIARILREAYPDKKIPTKTLPDFMVRLFSNFEKSLKPILVDLGTERKGDSSKAKKLLKWKPLSPQEAVLSCARSAIDLGLIKD